MSHELSYLLITQDAGHGKVLVAEHQVESSLRCFNCHASDFMSQIAIEQQAQQHLRGVRFPTAGPIVGIQRREVKLSHAVHYEARQMVGGQTVAQAHRQIQCLVVVHGFECSFHAHQYTITDGECLFLSDKLLARRESSMQRVNKKE